MRHTPWLAKSVASEGGGGAGGEPHFVWLVPSVGANALADFLGRKEGSKKRRRSPPRWR